MNENKTSKLNNLVRILKELHDKKKYRSLLILFIYFLFFLILFIFVNINKNNKVQTNSNQNSISFSSYNIYEFSTVININDEVYNIEGKRYKNKYEIIFEDEKLTLLESEINNSNLNLNVVNALIYNPVLISDLVTNAELVSEKKVILDGSVICEYSISLEKYYNILNKNGEKENLNIADNLNNTVLIKITKLNSNVISSEIDLSDLYKYYNNDDKMYIIKISYSNINNVLEF